VMQEFTRAGADAAASPRDVACRAEIVLFCLPTLDTIREVLLGNDSLSQGTAMKTCVNFSTAGATFVQEMAQALSPHGVTLLDCPISGGAARARDASLSIMASGDRDAYERVKPLLDCMAADVFYLGPQPGQAQIMKLLNNMVSFAGFIAACEAFAMGAKAGLDPDAMVATINTGTGRNTATTHKFPQHILPRTFDYGAALAIPYKDISLYLQEAERLGVPMWLAPVLKQVIWYAITQDGDGEDLTTLVKHYEKWCGVEIVGAAASART
jgi:3-hydroxyisobutyrate dehydrogenase-like beta-hydroxyacid dehydrogenase